MLTHEAGCSWQMVTRHLKQEEAPWGKQPWFFFPPFTVQMERMLPIVTFLSFSIAVQPITQNMVRQSYIAIPVTNPVSILATGEANSSLCAHSTHFYSKQTGLISTPYRRWSTTEDQQSLALFLPLWFHYFERSGSCLDFRFWTM